MRVWAVDMPAYTHPLLVNADPDADFDKWRFVRDITARAIA